MFDAFLAIYKARIADLLRISTGGTGVLPGGAIHPDLVRRLADEAAKSAGHVLNMCIRALDYLPPVDVTFFEYLRGTDHRRLRPGRRRCAQLSGRIRRGVPPPRHLPAQPREPDSRTRRGRSRSTPCAGRDSTSTGCRREREKPSGSSTGRSSTGSRPTPNECFYLQDRKQLFEVTRSYRRILHRQLRAAFKAVPAFARELGLDPGLGFEVHELRRAMRVTLDYKYIPQLVVVLTQSKLVKEDRHAGAYASVAARHW